MTLDPYGREMRREFCWSCSDPTGRPRAAALACGCLPETACSDCSGKTGGPVPFAQTRRVRADRGWIAARPRVGCQQHAGGRLLMVAV